MIDFDVWRDSAKRLSAFVRRYPLENAIEFVTFGLSSGLAIYGTFLFATIGDRLMDPALAPTLFFVLLLSVLVTLVDRLSEEWLGVRVSNRERWRYWNEALGQRDQRYTLSSAFQILAPTQSGLTAVLALVAAVVSVLVLGFLLFSIRPHAAPWVLGTFVVVFVLQQAMTNLVGGVRAERNKLAEKRNALIHTLEYTAAFNRGSFLSAKLTEGLVNVRQSQDAVMRHRNWMVSTQDFIGSLAGSIVTLGVLYLQGGEITFVSLGYVALAGYFFNIASLTSNLIANLRNDLRTLREFDQKPILPDQKIADVAILAKSPNELRAALKPDEAQDFDRRAQSIQGLITQEDWARDLETFSYGERVRLLSAWLTAQNELDLGPELFAGLDAETRSAWQEAGK